MSLQADRVANIDSRVGVRFEFLDFPADMDVNKAYRAYLTGLR